MNTCVYMKKVAFVYIYSLNYVPFLNSYFVNGRDSVESWWTSKVVA